MEPTALPSRVELKWKPQQEGRGARIEISKHLKSIEGREKTARQYGALFTLSSKALSNIEQDVQRNPNSSLARNADKMAQVYKARESILALDTRIAAMKSGIDVDQTKIDYLVSQKDASQKRLEETLGVTPGNTDLDLLERQLVEGFVDDLRKSNGYFLNGIHRISTALSPQDQHSDLFEIQDTEVGWIVARFLSETQGMSKTPDPRDTALKRLVGLVNGNIQKGEIVNTTLDPTETNWNVVAAYRLIIAKDPMKTLRKIETETEADRTIILEDPMAQALSYRRFFQETHRAFSRGEKIVMTPHTRKIQREIKRVDSKRNGMSRVHLYGPPGTGKTENLVSYIRSMGFKERVISMHYWTTYSQLIGQESVQVQGMGDPLTAIQNRSEYFKKLSTSDFSRLVQNWVSQSSHGSNLLENTSWQDVLHFAGSQAEHFQDMEMSQLSDEDWVKVQNGIVEYLDNQAFSAALGVDGKDSFIAGELLLCIEKGELPVLDELDKIGPFAEGAVSRILNLSPGKDVYKTGNKEYHIPGWFGVFATSNTTRIGEKPEQQYLFDRFDHMYIGYPPVHDKLMIAGAWLSDADGNLGQLSTQDQQQLGYVVRNIWPDLEAMYVAGKLDQPPSLRVFHELSSLLINPDSGKRSDLSIIEAVEKLLLEQRQLTKLEEIKKVLAAHRHALENSLTAVRFDDQSRDALGEMSRAEAITEFLANLNQPLVQQIRFSEGIEVPNKLQGEKPEILPLKKLEKVYLDEDQTRVVARLIKYPAKTSEQRADSLNSNRNTTTVDGQIIMVHDNKFKILRPIPGDPTKGALISEMLMEQGNYDFYGMSPLGDTLYATREIGLDKIKLLAINPIKGKKFGDLDLEAGQSIAGFLENGSGVFLRQGKNLRIWMPQVNGNQPFEIETSKIRSDSRVHIESSDDGRYALVRIEDDFESGQSYLIDVWSQMRRTDDSKRLHFDFSLGSGSFAFVGNNLIVDRGSLNNHVDSPTFGRGFLLYDI